VKNFLKSFADDYPIEVVYCGGDPRLIIMDQNGNELETIELDNLNEEQIAENLHKRGFNKYQ
jgi:hypothetical protein